MPDMSSSSPATAEAAAATLRYPFETPPAPGQALAIAPGVYWLRMPMPFALDHINLWALADADAQGPGWAIVDSGPNTPQVMAAWHALLDAGGALAGPLGTPARVTRVLATHMHPDHVGTAGWLTRKFDCRLWMTRLEYLACRAMVSDTGREAPDDAIRFLQQAGWSEPAVDAYRARFGAFGRLVHRLPDSFVRLADAQVLTIGEQRWRVVVGSGHSPEHACLVCDALGLLISGDQVLPRITSNVSVFPTEPEADPLGDWLASIAQLRATLGDHLLVLPAHGEPFHGLHTRLDRLAHSAESGLQRLRRRLAQAPTSAVDAFEVLFARPVGADGTLLGLATGEAIAHLNHLHARGQAQTALGEDGVRRWWIQGAADR